MGRVREFSEEEKSATKSSSSLSSLSEALLITTMCIVGLPVEVHVKDGSIFSGIFHTASFHNGYGIALKKVRLVKKGTHNSNLVNGGLIDTLVVRPGDLVQVLAKGVMLPAESASCEATTYDGGAVPGTCMSFQDSDNGAVAAGEQLNNKRHVGITRLKEEDGYHHASELIKELIDVKHSSTNDAFPNAKVTTQLHSEVLASEVSDDKIRADACNSVAVLTTVAPRNPITNRTTKESKLNPGAKIFSPSLSNFRSSPTPAPTVSSVAYVTNNVPAVQIAAAQQEAGFRSAAPLSSWPVKVVPYVTSAPATADNGFQYSQPIASHVVTRKQPIRHAAVYQPLQPLPSYLHANHQNGMFGRPGQLVYVHPATHDVIQGSPTLSQAPHPFLNSHPIHVTKHEGILADQASVPPLIANGQQPYLMPSQVQLSQPMYPSMRPVPIFSPNLAYSAKFP